jgi:hypothetical protein
MNPTAAITPRVAVAFAYEVGEEVLARLDGLEPLPVTPGDGEDSPLPSWTIGTIVDRQADSDPAYLVTFLHEGAQWICWVPEEAVEGTV